MRVTSAGRDQLMDKKWTRVATPQDGTNTTVARSLPLSAHYMSFNLQQFTTLINTSRIDSNCQQHLSGSQRSARERQLSPYVPTPSHNSLNVTNKKYWNTTSTTRTRWTKVFGRGPQQNNKRIHYRTAYIVCLRTQWMDVDEYLFLFLEIFIWTY